MEIIPYVLQTRIKYLMKEQSMKVKDLSKETGLSQSYLHDLIRGKRGTKRPSMGTLFAISKALSVDLEILMSLPLHLEEALRPLPQEFSGITQAQILNLLSNDPSTGEVLIETLIRVARLHGLSDDNFAHVMRSFYMESHLKMLQEGDETPFAHIEKEAEACRQELSKAGWRPDQGIEKHELLRDYLVERWGVQIDETYLAVKKGISGVKSIFLAGPPPRLLINPGLTPEQRTVIWAREIGFFLLDIVNRGTKIYPAPRRNSFDQLKYAVHATFFGSALLMPREEIKANLVAVFKAEKWDEQQFLRCSYGHRPGLFFHRIASVLKELGLKEYSFFRYTYELRKSGTGDKPTREDIPRITDALNFTSLPDVKRLGEGEDRCTLWGGARAIERWIQRYGKDPGEGQLCVHIQKSLTTGLTYPKEKAPHFLVISIAYPSGRIPEKLSAVSIALRIDNDPDFKKKVAFLDDPQIETENGEPFEVALSCQRCARKGCPVRIAEPRILQNYRQHIDQKEILKELEQENAES